ncbi:MAG: hypothetical protein R3B93_19805 [Bacteroidia bacterium]
MSITKNLVELHGGGKIWVESQVGEGSTSTCNLSPKSHEKSCDTSCTLYGKNTSVQNGHEERKFVSENKGEAPTESSVLIGKINKSGF